jgi:uncharacterized protein
MERSGRNRWQPVANGTDRRESGSNKREPLPWVATGCRRVRMVRRGSTLRVGEGRTVEPRVNVITLAVDDLERALGFYRDGLGLQTKGVVASDLVDERTGAAGAIVIFELENGLLLTLYPRTELAKDAALPDGPPQSGEFSLGHLVASRTEVDRILEQAAAAGAVVTAPHDRPWDIYSGYFRDPDGHLWEIIWNPGRGSTRSVRP